MVLQKQTRRVRLAVLAIPLMALVWVAVSTLAWGHATQGPVQAQEELTAGMALSASGTDVTCEAGKCNVPAGGDFTVSVVTADAPEGGYLGLQTLVYFGSLTYNEAAEAEDEILWPENILPLRTSWSNWVGHGGASDITAPFDDISEYEGTLVQLSMTCSSDVAEFPLALLAFSAGNPQGSVYSVPDEAGTESIIVPTTTIGEVLDEELEASLAVPPHALADLITINCSEEDEDDGDGADDGADDGDDDGEGDDAGDDDAEQPQPTALPGTGSGPGSSGSAAAGLWVIISVLLVAGAGLGAAGWKYARGGQAS